MALKPEQFDAIRMMALPIFNEITDLCDKISQKLDDGHTLRDVERDLNEIRANIDALIKHDHPKVSRVGRFFKAYLKETLKLRKMIEAGGYTARQLKRQAKRNAEAKAKLYQALDEIKEVGKGGV